ncbi:MAG: TIGR03960 family B12-binding radical SAM protein, partial [Planctomycetota bacterium]|nr:TIGR03960 family B12-binding radical SAM protein [Planctomycetota bacterium]
MCIRDSHILYHVLNSRPDIACERVFCPMPDAEAEMRARGVPLHTLETFTPVRRFDVLGFSMGYELCASNVLTMLDLAGIPLPAEARGPEHPIVVIGGHAAFSPEPLAGFADAFAIGDGEELAVEIALAIGRMRRAGLGREELLHRLALDVPGVYVPRFYRPLYGPDGRTTGFNILRPGLPFPVRRRILAGIEDAPAPTRPPVPYVQTVHDRYTVEIMRGCPNACRFCQAGAVTKPVRMRSPERIMAILREAIANTGYDGIGLLSLSSGEYPGIEKLAAEIQEEFRERRVSVSLPSMRLGKGLVSLAPEAGRVRNPGLTLAPEAASEHLRRIIGKRVRDEDLFEGVNAAFRAGYRSVKLYFMIGLPGETDDDLRAIGTLCEKVSRIRREATGGPPAGVTASVSSFVPKAGTPFQWEPMCSRAELRRRQEIVRKSSRDRRVKFKFHDVEVSFLEGVLARGDRRVGRAILEAWRRGARFDGWDDRLDLAAWEAAFTAARIDPGFHALRRRDPDEFLPWSVVETGAGEAFLRRERERASAEIAAVQA